MINHSAMRLSDQLLVTPRIVCNPDRRTRLGGTLGLDRHALERILFPFEADIVLCPQQLQDLDPLDQPLHSVLVGDVVGSGFDLTTRLRHDTRASDKNGPSRRSGRDSPTGCLLYTSDAAD